MTRVFVCRSLRTPMSSLALGLGLAFGGIAVSAAGCSSSSSPCTAQFSGDVTETGTLAAGCGALTQDVDGGASAYVLKLSASSAHVADLEVSITLGAAPAAGMLSSDTLADWTAMGLGGDGGSCGYSAGGQAVPTGSFTLNVTSVSGDAASRVAHGTLDDDPLRPRPARDGLRLRRDRSRPADVLTARLERPPGAAQNDRPMIVLHHHGP